MEGSVIIFEMLTQFLRQCYKTFFLWQRQLGKMRKIVDPRKYRPRSTSLGKVLALLQNDNIIIMAIP